MDVVVKVLNKCVKEKQIENKITAQQEVENKKATPGEQSPVSGIYPPCPQYNPMWQAPGYGYYPNFNFQKSRGRGFRPRGQEIFALTTLSLSCMC